MQKVFLGTAASMALLLSATMANATYMAGNLTGGPYDPPQTASGGNTVYGTASNVAGPDGTPPGATFFDDGNQGGGNLGSGINTNTPLSSFIAPDGSFTMGAWVNLANNSGDNMVFGTDVGNPMHLGFRGGDAYFGFWGNDSSAGGAAAGATGQWAYMTWVYDNSGSNSAGSGAQKIYENGVLLSESDGHSPYANGGNLTIATNGGNGGDLYGALDDARVYNVAMSDNQVAALYADSSTPDASPTPEPASLTLVGLGALGLLGYARRRQAASAA